MRRGQIMVETALSLSVLLTMVVAAYAGAIMVAQRAIGQSITVSICEGYAETPDLQDVVSGWASFSSAWQVKAPDMSISVGGHVLRMSNEGIVVTPIVGNLPQQFSCEATINLGGNLPFFGTIGVTHRYTYTTFRRYGTVGGRIPVSPVRIESSRQPLPLLYVFSAIAPPVGIKLGTHKRKAQGLVEYAMVVFTLAAFLVFATWSLLYMAFVSELAARGAITMTYAAVGPNPSLVDISFSYPTGACSFAVGEPVDCNGVSPFSAAAPTVPDIFMRGYWGTTITIE